ncbi:MAG: hypothetical protein COT91_05100 [Candidatus Doudnabacteria bacterium CG10_big_fil_rev_8_21_14_0_10_41_10]|uniref:EfeO-type cupredoxin-like domain-containing protein n=1 Tax=Candidatus Doudnabacteria bacterium CG10_big_fil_rev_8_21_14_0_10_41_10 TaxID=1974551 RepID=A0A2H0VEN1_9BACT|nr:MAG: hypothetical protein COT91_05100 [Candidatus Doudnabacteria bacterium CG10_big_fil_rev_8_21_14_0_10_41_10]
MGKYIVIIIIAIIAIAGGVLYFNSQDITEDQMLETQDMTTEEERNGMTSDDENILNDGSTVEDGEAMMDDGGQNESGSEIKEFAVTGIPFEFSLSEIRVNKGDTVRIAFTNGQGTHDWVIDEFNARTNILQTEQTETIEFVADQTGEFEYYCSVGNHRQLGMKGILIVQ